MFADRIETKWIEAFKTQFALCGGHSILRPLPLERMYRDSRCGSLMLPWTAEVCIERLGRECLYEPGERDD
jgi:hypothetical protein